MNNSPLISQVSFDFAWEETRWLPWQETLEPLICQAGEIILRTLCPEHGPGEISWAFVDNQTIAELNGEYRGQHKPTNVLSFGYMNQPSDITSWQDYTCLGDVILAFETTQKEAKEQHKDFISHCLHLCIHGFLHLLGYDHQSDEDADIMENLEIQFLKYFNISNPYEKDSFS